MDHIPWQHLLQPWHLLIIPLDLRIIECLSKLTQKFMNSLHLLPPLAIEAYDLPGVHQLLLLAELLDDELVFLDVFEIALADGYDVIEDLALLGTVGFRVYCLNLLDNVAIFVVFKVLVYYPAIYFAARGGVGRVGQHPHDGDIDQQPIVHVPGFTITHVKLILVLRVVLGHGLPVDLDTAQLRIYVLQVQRRHSEGGPAQVQGVLDALAQHPQVFRHAIIIKYDQNHPTLTPSLPLLFTPILIILMGEFYNKYKRLFTEPSQIDHHPERGFAQLYNYKTPKVNNLKRYLELESMERRPQPAIHKLEKLGRSPALDEFQRHILPRLKTEPDVPMQSSAPNMQSAIYSPYSRLPSISFESKPRYLTDIRREEPKYYLSKPMPQLKYQQDFIDNRNKKVASKSIIEPSFSHDQINQHLLSVPIVQKAPKFVLQIPKIQKIAIEPPKRQKIVEEKSTSKKTAEQSGKRIRRQQNVYESQLYGINENPYAFAGSKLSDIKMIQRFYPKGIVNSYKNCLLRRHLKKGQLADRRQRLRALLQQDQKGFSPSR